MNQTKQTLYNNYLENINKFLTNKEDLDNFNSNVFVSNDNGVNELVEEYGTDTSNTDYESQTWDSFLD